MFNCKKPLSCRHGVCISNGDSSIYACSFSINQTLFVSWCLLSTPLLSSSSSSTLENSTFLFILLDLSSTLENFVSLGVCSHFHFSLHLLGFVINFGKHASSQKCRRVDDAGIRWWGHRRFLLVIVSPAGRFRSIFRVKCLSEFNCFWSFLSSTGNEGWIPRSRLILANHFSRSLTDSSDFVLRSSRIAVLSSSGQSARGFVTSVL